MGQTTQEQIDRWIEFAFQRTTLVRSKAVVKKLTMAGEFLTKTARLPEEKLKNYLPGIDFYRPVTVERLESKIYVQYRQKRLGLWFTDVGLTPEQVGLSAGPTDDDMKNVKLHEDKAIDARRKESLKRKRKLFVPSGAVHALKSNARRITDKWTIGELFDKLDADTKKRLTSQLRGGGTQYIVHDSRLMNELPE